MKISSLKLLTDENISPRIVSFLRQKELDVVDVKEKEWHGSEDKHLMEIAHNNKRFILTHDADFGTIAINEGFPCYGIIYLRLKNLQISNVLNILEKVLITDKDMSKGTLLVVEETRLRIRTI